MSQCDLCEHAKIKAIDAALDVGRAPNLVRVQFRLSPQSLSAHLAHRSAPSLEQPAQVSMAETINPLLDKALTSNGESQSTIFPCQPDPIPEGLRRLAAFVEATEAAMVPADPIRLVKQHVTEAARIWWAEVEDDRRSPERLQLILAEAFADPNLGL